MAVHIAKVNALAGLSSRATMSFIAVRASFELMETAAVEAHHAAALLESGMVEAMSGDFSFCWTPAMPMSSYAAGALVALCGKSEGGKTLSRNSGGCDG